MAPAALIWAAVTGFAVGRVSDDDPAQPGLQIGQVLGQAEDGHDLGGGGDVESGLPGAVRR